MEQNQKQIKVCVSGCRNYYNYQVVSDYLDFVLQNLRLQGEIIIVHGACPSGVDQLAGRYARERQYKCIEFPADWGTFGNYAGPKRNGQMCAECDYFVCFWDGCSKGTRNMIENVKRAKKPLKIKNIDI